MVVRAFAYSFWARSPRASSIAASPTVKRRPRPLFVLARMKSPLTIHSMTIVIPTSRRVNRARFQRANARSPRFLTATSRCRGLLRRKAVTGRGGRRFRLIRRRGRDLNPRRTKPPETVFETAAFDRSATPPRLLQEYWLTPLLGSGGAPGSVRRSAASARVATRGKRVTPTRGPRGKPGFPRDYG